MSIRTHPSYATAHENLGDIYAKMASPGLRQGAATRQRQHRRANQAGLIKELFSSSARTAPSPAQARPTPAPRRRRPWSPRQTPARRASPLPQRRTTRQRASRPSRNRRAATTPRRRSADPADEVLEDGQRLGQAWSNNDVGGYLGFYAADFQTPDGEARGDWEAARKARIAKPKKIDVARRVAEGQIHRRQPRHGHLPPELPLAQPEGDQHQDAGAGQGRRTLADPAGTRRQLMRRCHPPAQHRHDQPALRLIAAVALAAASATPTAMGRQPDRKAEQPVAQTELSNPKRCWSRR